MTHSEKEFIFGMHPVMEAIRAGRQIDRILVRQGLRGELYQEMMQMVSRYRVPWQVVPREKLDQITRKNHQGVIAWLAAVEFHDVEMLLPQIFERGEEPLLLMLDGVTDVRNFGAIVRSALCLRAHAVIIPEKNSARVSADAVKASAGALNAFPVCRVKSLTRCLTFLKESGVKAAAASEKAKTVISAATLTGPLVLIVGSEEKGISPKLLEMTDNQVSIPVTGSIGSLNVSVSAGIALYEILRQRETAIK